MKTNIYTKLFKLQNELGSISKDATNPFYKSKYFDINSLIGQLKPLLEKHNLVLLQPITDNCVRSIIFDLDGGSVESAMKLPKDLDAQKIGSAITYYRRYTLQSLLALQAIDDDGNLAIKPKKPLINNKISKPLLLDNSPELKNAIKGMSNGASIDDVKKIYRLTPYITEKLLNFKI
tara:strand:- start:2306 stop:2836 length:531 start_codon:yes stop_codon:yes gene_type:complete